MPLRVEFRHFRDNLPFPPQSNSWVNMSSSSSYAQAGENIDLVVWHGNIGVGDVGELYRDRSHLRVLVVSTGGPMSEIVAQIKKDPEWPVTIKKEGIYGAARNGSLHALSNTNLWERLVAFFLSGELLSTDREVEHFLGLDLSVRRLAFRFALEIAHQEVCVRKGISGQEHPATKQTSANVQTLLAPALEIAKEVSDLVAGVQRIKTALSSSDKELCEAISEMLDELRR